LRFHISPLKGVRPMRAQSELYLYKQLIGNFVVPRILRSLVLGANLRELAGPVGQHNRAAVIVEMGIKRPVGVVVAGPYKPPPRKLVVTGGVVTERPLEPGSEEHGTNWGDADVRRGLVLLTPDEFAARRERAVNRACQGFPAKGGVNPVKIGEEVGAEQVVPARIRSADGNVAIVREVAIRAQVANYAYVILVGGGEHVR